MLPGKLNPFPDAVIRHIFTVPKGFQKVQRGVIAPESRRRHQFLEEMFNGSLFLLVGVGLGAQDEKREEDVVGEDVDWACCDEIDFRCELGDRGLEYLVDLGFVWGGEGLVAVDQTGVVYCADDRVHPFLYVFSVCL